MSTLRDKRAADEDGFTLIELLVVVVILGILIAIAIPVYLNYQKGANDKAAQSDLRNAVAVLEQCNTDNPTYPSVATFTTTSGPNTGTFTGCANQKINLSAGTSMKYIPASGNVSYVLGSSNSSGVPKVYCYNSANAGSVKDITSSTYTAASTVTASAC